MRVFKFGGASIKNAEAVKNVLQLLQHTGYEDTFIVVSALGQNAGSYGKPYRYQNHINHPRIYW